MGNLLKARLVVDLWSVPELKGDVVATATDCAGAFYAVCRQTSEAARVDRGHGSFPKAQFERPAQYTVARWDRGNIQCFTTDE